MAERMALDRDISLLEMTGARYHADQITTARALPALERAKANGLDTYKYLRYLFESVPCAESEEDYRKLLPQQLAADELVLPQSYSVV